MRTSARATVKAVALFLACSFVLAGCQTLSVLQSRSTRADSTAENNGWVRRQFVANQFTLRGYRPSSVGDGETLAVYIEGDGAAWTGQRQPADPTPSDTRTLRLAILDPTPNRLYLARPCQYLQSAALRRCSSDYWARARYAPEVVAALDAAIEQSKRRTNARRITLFGYSGGGALAVLLAARRSDVSRIVTIAGNLDHETWIQLHRQKLFDGLIYSLNAADAAERVSGIEQIHFVGADDELMPIDIAQAYLKKVTDRSKIAVVSVPGADHTCCWVEKWPDLLRRYVYPGR